MHARKERKIKRKSMSMEKKRKKEKKIYVSEGMKEKKRIEKRGSNKDMRGMDQVKEKKNKVQGRMSR
jgi:hypothetical protein